MFDLRSLWKSSTSDFGGFMHQGTMISHSSTLCATAILSFAIVLFTGGCGWMTTRGTPFFSSPGEGVILVGRPEVFTRQRLVSRRLTEQQWLENTALGN